MVVGLYILIPSASKIVKYYKNNSFILNHNMTVLSKTSKQKYNFLRSHFIRRAKPCYRLKPVIPYKCFEQHTRTVVRSRAHKQKYKNIRPVIWVRKLRIRYRGQQQIYYIIRLFTSKARSSLYNFNLITKRPSFEVPAASSPADRYDSPAEVKTSETFLQWWKIQFREKSQTMRW